MEPPMPFGAESVTPRSVAVGNLLQDHHPFFVPRYQRSYAWEAQVAAFTDDIKDLVAGDPQESSHFFGGLVCIEHTDHTKARPHEYEIVDGQQRLATVVMALAQIHRAARNIEKRAESDGDESAAASAKTLAEDTHDRFLKWRNANVSAGRTETLPRLQLSLADSDFFEDLISGKPGTPVRESHELLAAAEAQIRSALIIPAISDDKTYQECVAELDRLRTAVISQSHVIQIVSHDRERAYQLFSVLNDRGRSLEDADLLRSYTLETVQSFPEKQDKVAKLWDEILSAPSKDVSEFFRAYYPSTTGIRTSIPMFKKLREEYFPSGAVSSETAADVIVESVRKFNNEKDTFLLLSQGAWPYDTEVDPGQAPASTAWQRDRLRRLVQTLKHDLALPLLLSAANSVDEKKFADLVYMLEIFAFRYKNVCGGHATAPGKLYYAEAKRIRQNVGSVDWGSLRSGLRNLIDKSAPDDQFKNSLANRLRYDHGGAQRGNIRELLTTLEEHSGWLAAGAVGNPKPDMTMVFDLARVTLEHIYPQNPLPGDRDINLNQVRHHLGNLTFFGPEDNSSAGNKSFADKQAAYYASSRIRMTSELSSLVGWDVEAYKQRESQILENACKVFRL
ncbi:DUF262 domain-containing protein [Streptodolium elevatio]